MVLAGTVGGVGDGVRLVAGSLLCLAALKSSRHMCHAAMKQACTWMGPPLAKG